MREAEDSPSSFDGRPESLEALATKQGVKAATNFDDLLGDFWPEDEGAEDLITALREWRRDGDV